MEIVFTKSKQNDIFTQGNQNRFFFMAHNTRKINPEDDLGFGPQPVIKNQPLMNKDGSPNVRRIGLSMFNTSNNYQALITMSWAKFWVVILTGYLVVNIIFAFIYTWLGPNSLDGTTSVTPFEHYMDAFFFSAQTMSTVGYGHISPRGMATNSVAAAESMMGLLAFALATGLLYGRFSRPSAQIIYSKHLLVAPYRDGSAVMFRLANKRRNMLIDLDIEIIFSYNETVDGKTVRRFYPLELERRKVSVLTLNWTVVHPLDENSPMTGMTKNDMIGTEAGFSILLRAFDDTFSQTVHSRTQYQAHEIVWGAKFVPAFTRDEAGIIVLDLSKISEHEPYDIAAQPSIQFDLSKV